MSTIVKLLTVTTLALSVASPASAGNKPRKGDKDKGDKDKGRKGKGSRPTTIVSGGGERLHFSLGGDIKTRRGKVWGNFIINAHPVAPAGNVQAGWCRYFEFANPTFDGNTVRFEASGKCAFLSTAGVLTKTDARGRFIIIDNGSADDNISVELIGPTGISIPSGPLSSGNLTVAGP